MPSVVTKFTTTLSNDGKTLTFNETTGVYNASTNPTGWGAPNELVGDATAATLDVLDPSGTTTTLNLYAASPGFPSSSSSDAYTFVYSNIGGSTDTPFPDGLYVFTYKVTLPGGVVTATNRDVIYFNSEKCVHLMLATIEVGDCNCKKEDLNQACMGYILLEGLKANACLGTTDRVADYVAAINNICTNTSCSTC